MTERPYSRLVSAAALLAMLFAVAPAVFIVFYAFSPTGYLTWPPAGLTLKWFTSFFENERLQQALHGSLLIAATVTPLSLLIALPTAVIAVRRRSIAAMAVVSLVSSPLLIPGVIIGIAFLSLASRLGLGLGFGPLVVAMLCFTVPFALRPIVANLAGVDADLEKAARNLGASPVGAFLRITLPQLKPGLIAGGVFVFVEAVDNFSIAVFLTSVRTTTLPVEAYSYIRDFDDPTIAGMATVLIGVSLLLVIAVERTLGLDRFLALK